MEETTKLPMVGKTASWIENRIHKMLQERSEKKSIHRSKALGLSQIGKCERDLWAGLNGVPSERDMPGRMLVLFGLGDAVETQIIGLLADSGFELQENDPETDEQFEVEGFERRVLGHFDGKIKLKPEADWALLEIKSAKDTKFDELIEAGSYEAWNPVYGAQVHVYMGRAELSRCLVAVQCKNTSRLYFELIDFDPDKYRELWLKAGRIVTATEVPERPSEAKSQYCAHCKWCERNQWCWGPLAGVRFDD